MDSLKTWAVEVLIKKMGPSLVKGALAALVGLVAAHQGILASLGITADTHTLTINLDTFSNWLLVAGTGGIMALLTAIQHHAAAAIEKKPQSGDLRQEPETPVPGGDRPIDKGETPK